MATRVLYFNSSPLSASASSLCNQIPQNPLQSRLFFKPTPTTCLETLIARYTRVRCSADPIQAARTCKNCKTQFDPSVNHARACRYHTAHFGGETKRKFESVHSGGTMNTPDSGKVLQYWHCCGSEDPFDPGCTAAPHFSYDD